MKAIKFYLVVVSSTCLLVFLPKTVSASGCFSIGIGTSFGHHYHSHFHGGYYSHYPWHRRHYGWPYYGSSCYWGPGYYHWPGYHYSSIGIRLTAPHRPVRAEAPQTEPARNPQLSEAMKRKKSELIKIVKIGDKNSRIRAIEELVVFSADTKARVTLEEVLLSDPDPDLRKQVATQLGKAECKQAVPALKIAKAKDSNRDVRQTAYRAIIMIDGY